jgi:acetyl esterase/lipase
MKRTLILATMIAIVLVVSGCRAAPEASSEVRQPAQPQLVAADRDRQYTSSRFIDVFYPESDGPWPTIVLFHGGEENKNRMRGMAKAAAKGGLVVFVPDYRDSPTDLESDPLAALQDAACAMRYARAHAGEYGGLSERLVSAGHSLGGNMAAIMALDGDQFSGDCLVKGDISAMAAGVVGLDGAYDQFELDTALAPLNALAYLTDGAGDEALTFNLYTGEVEQLHRQAERFRDALTAAGHKVTLIRQPELGHGMFSSPLAPGLVDGLVAAAYERYQ